MTALTERVETPPAPAAQRHQFDAFGLRVDCAWHAPGSRPLADDEQLPAPATTVRLLARAEIDALWAAPGERIFEPAYPDGRTRFTVDHAPSGYRLWFEGFGRYAVSADGAEIGCESSDLPNAMRERFLCAQALPLAAALQGFELMHASGVCAGGGVAAFVGASGLGKTSIAIRLVLRGRGFVTDDVLALRPGPDGPLVHPGPPFMAVPEADKSLIEDGRGPLGPGVGVSDKVHASPSTPGRALPLRAIFHLETGPALTVSELDGGDVHRLLASGFAPYLMTPERLRRHLEMTEMVASVVGQFRLQVPRTNRLDAIADTIEARLRELEV